MYNDIVQSFSAGSDFSDLIIQPQELSTKVLEYFIGLRPDATLQLFYIIELKKAKDAVISDDSVGPCTDLGLRGSPDGPDTVQSITRLHSFFLFYLTGVNNSIPSTDFKLAICREADETQRSKGKRKEKGKR